MGRSTTTKWTKTRFNRKAKTTDRFNRKAKTIRFNRKAKTCFNSRTKTTSFNREAKPFNNIITQRIIENLQFQLYDHSYLCPGQIPHVKTFQKPEILFL